MSLEFVLPALESRRPLEAPAPGTRMRLCGMPNKAARLETSPELEAVYAPMVSLLNIETRRWSMVDVVAAVLD